MVVIFGATPKDALGIPVSPTYVPGTANSDLTALEGAAVSTDSNAKPSAAAVMAGKAIELAALTAGSLNADLVPSTDVSAFGDFTLTVTGTWTGTLTVAFNNDNAAFSSSWVQASNSASWVQTITANGQYHIPKRGRYLRIRMTAYTSGTANGVLEENTLGQSIVPPAAITANAGTNLNTSALALEAGHLATIDTHTPAQGQATMANSSPVVIASDQSAVKSKPDFSETTGLTAGSLNADLVASLDVSGYQEATIQVSGVWSGTLTVQGSMDNGTTVNTVSVFNLSSTSSPAISSITGNNIYRIPLGFHYLRIRMTAYTSGTANGVLNLKTFATLPVAPTTVNPGNTQNTTPWLTQGPTTTGTQAANTASNTVIKGSAGALWSAVITTLGTAALDVFDNASTNSGTKLLSIPASAAVGTIYNFTGGTPAANGIVSAGVANCPAVTFSYR